LTDLPAGSLTFQPAEAWRARLPSLEHQPWVPRGEDVLAWWDATAEGTFDTFWMSDGLSQDWREALLERAEAQGNVTVFQSARPLVALRPVQFEDGRRPRGSTATAQ
ncbi:MAG: hypothetical protein AAGG72_10730, partial [Pseudomonadota bacterium]